MKPTVTIRIDPDTKSALDTIAAALDRDRSYIVNEALAAYVDTHRWQVEHIRRGLREADAGRFVSEARLKKVLGRLRQR